jgi:hypothetical protein
LRFEFEWNISDPMPVESGRGMVVYVRERLVGTDLMNTFGPLSQPTAEAFIKARRAFVNRTITTRTGAMQVFEPRPQLQALSLALNTPKESSDEP